MSLRIVFMGTPDFALPSLKALVKAGHEVVGVVCQPDRPRGRSGKLAMCEAKECALEMNLPVFQFERIRSQQSLDALRALKPELFVTAAYGQILSNKVLAIPEKGTVNVHASLLPKYRGSAPINRCIMAGERVTGVTTMFTERGLDTGDMLLSREMDILPGETAGELTARLAELGAQVLIETLERLEAGTLERVPQDESKASYQPMLVKEDGLIDWSRAAKEIEHQVLGVNPWPGAYTPFGNGVLKVWRAHAVNCPCEGADMACGQVICADRRAGLLVKCGEGALSLDELQLPGAKRLNARDYLNGKPMPTGTQLGAEVTNG